MNLDTNAQDEQLELGLALNSLRPLVDYDVLNPEQYINAQEEDSAIHRVMSIEEIVEAVREDHDDDNAVDYDDDGPEIPKITVSMALQSINNLSLFLEQQAPTSSTAPRLFNCCRPL